VANCGLLLSYSIVGSRARLSRSSIGLAYLYLYYLGI
jgi:hypothetical protein